MIPNCRTLTNSRFALSGVSKFSELEMDSIKVCKREKTCASNAGKSAIKNDRFLERGLSTRFLILNRFYSNVWPGSSQGTGNHGNSSALDRVFRQSGLASKGLTALRFAQSGTRGEIVTPPCGHPQILHSSRFPLL